MALKIVTWQWGHKYSAVYVRKWWDGVQRNLKQPHELVVLTPDSDTRYLTDVRGCFCRLKMFSREWQERHEIAPEDRLVCTDLDVVFTGALDPLFDRPESFIILAGANAVNPCKFNGSLMMLRGGYHHEVWRDFSLEAAGKVPFFSFPDDQGWLWHKLPDAATWQVGKTTGVYSFQKPGWPGDDKLPDGARVVVFPGWRDPSKFQHLQWIKDHWS